MHRGPQAAVAAPAAYVPVAAPFHHAPNAALLIDFDNVTMGIRSDLGQELRNLLSSDIIKGKVAVQRAYADWRRYPQYIVPLSESSIDLIFAPAYGSSKKNATDIRLAIDALELVFTRPEIGTFILLSGDSDFSSLVIKLKEYGKYVIGVGIRESSSDLLIQNCDEYYSYNALAGLVKTSDEEQVKRDPWELVAEAIRRMKQNGDVMRSDRLKQVMQEIDSTFDEKDLGYSKFSKFCQEAVQRGLLSVTKLENGQLEVDVPQGSRALEAPPSIQATARVIDSREERDEAPERGRRGRRGGRGRGREERGAPEPRAVSLPADAEPSAPPREQPAHREEPARREEPPRAAVAGDIGVNGERLTRDEAFDLVRRAIQSLTASEDDAVRAGDVRGRARELLGRDSESLSERNFARILRDAHDANVIDLRRRGDDFEVARAAEAESVADQLAKAAAAHPAAGSAMSLPPLRRGMGPRGGGRGRPSAPGLLPPELLSIGVVDTGVPPLAAPEAATEPLAPEATASPAVSVPETEPAAEPEAETGAAPPAKAGKPRRSRGGAKKASRSARSAPAATPEPPAETPRSKPRRPRARKPAAQGSQ
jgi:uncharacterized protein (TIGR00288 family)